jgi:hypothetical protein
MGWKAKALFILAALSIASHFEVLYPGLLEPVARILWNLTFYVSSIIMLMDIIHLYYDHGFTFRLPNTLLPVPSYMIMLSAVAKNQLIVLTVLASWMFSGPNFDWFLPEGFNLHALLNLSALSLSLCAIGLLFSISFIYKNRFSFILFSISQFLFLGAGWKLYRLFIGFSIFPSQDLITVGNNIIENSLPAAIAKFIALIIIVPALFTIWKHIASKEIDPIGL